MAYKYPGFTLAHPFPEPRPKERFGYHGGADYAAKAGTPVPAQYGGTVFRSGYIKGYGMAVIVETQTAGDPIYTLYGHLGPNGMPEAGARIEPGQPIGEVASRAFNETFKLHYNPHLHLEIISHKANISRVGHLNIWSSDLTHRANPETFDINNPKFPYEITGPPPKPSMLPSARPAQEPAGPRMLPQQPTPGSLIRSPSSQSSLDSNPPLDIRPPQFRDAPVSGGGAVPPPTDFGSPIYFGEPSPPRQAGPFTLRSVGSPGSGTSDRGAFVADARTLNDDGLGRSRSSGLSDGGVFGTGAPAFNNYGRGNSASSAASDGDRFGNRIFSLEAFAPRHPSFPWPISRGDLQPGNFGGAPGSLWAAPPPIRGSGAQPGVSGDANWLPSPALAPWDGNTSHQSTTDAGVPAATPAASGPPYSVGGLPGLLAAVAGIDPAKSRPACAAIAVGRAG